jgi:hypothetical protein
MKLYVMTHEGHATVQRVETLPKIGDELPNYYIPTGKGIVAKIEVQVPNSNYDAVITLAK